MYQFLKDNDCLVIHDGDTSSEQDEGEDTTSGEDEPQPSSEDEALEQDITEQVQTNDTLLVWTEDKEHTFFFGGGCLLGCPVGSLD